MKDISQRVISTFEQVSFPEFQMQATMAKIDTGAYTGALHCTKIVRSTDKYGKKLTFSPFDRPEVTIITRDFALKHVRSSNGGATKRYFIKTHVVIRNQSYPIVLSLADRSDMRWPVLIGRKFLRQNRFLVDAGKARNVS